MSSPRSLQPGSSRWNYRAALLIVLAVCWALVSWSFVAPIVSSPRIAVAADDYWYFSNWFYEGGPYPHSHFGPGYPFVLYAIRLLGGGMVTAIVLQKAMVALTAALIFAFCRKANVPWTIATGVAFGYAIAPTIQGYSSLFMSETTYALATTVAAWLFLNAVEPKGHTRWAVLAFLVLGTSSLIRVNGLLMFAGFALIGAFFFPWKRLLVSVAIGCSPILVWSLLNYAWFGQLTPTSSGNANFAAHIVGPVMTDLTGRQEDWRPDVWFTDEELRQFDNPFEMSRAARDRALAFALEYPLQVLLGNVEGWFRTLLGPSRAVVLKVLGEQAMWVVYLSGLVQLLLTIGLVLFLLSAGWRKHPLLGAVVLLAFVAHVVPAGAGGYARMSVPLEAFACIALALVCARFWARRAQACS